MSNKTNSKKKCTVCKVTKSLNKFHNCKRARDGKKPDCKKCSIMASIKYNKLNWSKTLLHNKNWRERHKTKLKFMKLEDKFGITKKQYEGLLKKQNNKCAICKASQINLRRSLDVDHCHTTNKIRGLLCEKCNRGIGLFNDSVERLREVIIYLERE